MVLSDQQAIGIGLTVVGLVGIPLGVVLVRMWAKVMDHDRRIPSVEAKVESQANQIGDIKTLIATGFARIEEQIKTLFREQEHK